MSDLGRRALLGDKQAQEECTEKGIVLPCPLCGKQPEAIRHIIEHEARELGLKPYAVCCGGENCRSYFMGDTPKEAISGWNSRPAPPIGRCGECKHSWNQDEYGYINCTNLHVIMKQDDYCSLFEPKERTNEQIHNPAD